MTDLPAIIERVRSGVFHVVFLDEHSKRLGSGSAFYAHRHLITNGHVFDTPNGTKKIWIRRQEHKEFSQGLVIDVSDFISRRIIASPAEEFDYAVLNIPEINIFSPFEFELKPAQEGQIGADVAFFGYPLDKYNMTCHRGIISSIYRVNQTHNIQIDASVNPGNSGGPLIDLSSQSVIGFITRKATGLTKLFNEPKITLHHNIHLISNLSGGVILMGVDFKQFALAGQQQVLSLVAEIERTANVGIGYAFSSCHLLDDPLMPHSSEAAAAETRTS
jgi:hypothetical protein